ncbi:uncharacterized protein LOC127241463 [Andrographis paniculata]|uniref:uncharacterized protein LOC127241463 n=1 Tax=Andrographis paniculata TaxID=175694 RepID=UPI0021E7F39E|nr:uncharacterized protein LOC127241463 [Andrographis paniculata]
MNRNREKSGQMKSTPAEKSGDLRTTSLKAAVTVFIVLSVSVAFYSSFYSVGRPDFFRWSDIPDPAVYMGRLNSDRSPTNISHIAFGIGGSTRTWGSRVRYADLWWKPGITRGYVFLERRPDRVFPNRPGVPIRVSSDWRRFRRSSGPEAAVRIARVVVDLFRSGLPNVRWFVMGDDDTVFFPENLVAVLSKYDHREMVYVGGNSESVEQDVMHAYGMAFGGGGFAVSYPLAAQLYGAMDGCLNRYHYFYGSDQRIWACVGEYGVDLSRESGFHQLDIRGNPGGLLAAHPLAPLVSLHHLDDVQPLFPNKTQIESLALLTKAYDVDPSRTLQQCFCYHRKRRWSVSVSWGYTVQIHPKLMTAKELEMPVATFKTWRSWHDGPFTFNTRPESPDPCKHPVVFHLASVNKSSSNSTSTEYKKLDDYPKHCGKGYARALAIDNVVVIAPKMDPRQWKQSPRRECCDIKGSLGQGRMTVRIRKCRHTESVTI